MANSNKKKGQGTLIFIDANIYLDFYRARERSFELAMIKHIDANHDKIITTDQVLMEYKKNRQKVILETLAAIQEPKIDIAIPPFLTDSPKIKMINERKGEIEKHIKYLQNNVSEVLKNPGLKDRLYQSLQRLFKDSNQHHLGRNNELRIQIRELAWKRFLLGYPPRKESDTSYGDAINWEWIIYSAEQSGKNIVIVSRDRDYGEMYKKEPILNDWLSQEFKDRISQQRKITLTNKLSNAFKLINVSISPREQKQEEELISNLSQKEFSLKEDIFKIIVNDTLNEKIYNLLSKLNENK